MPAGPRPERRRSSGATSTGLVDRVWSKPTRVPRCLLPVAPPPCPGYSGPKSSRWYSPGRRVPTIHQKSSYAIAPSSNSSTAVVCVWPSCVVLIVRTFRGPVAPSPCGVRVRSSGASPFRSRRRWPWPSGSRAADPYWKPTILLNRQCSSTGVVDGSPLAMFGACSIDDQWFPLTHTRCVTHLPLIFWMEVPICVLCRSCWDTPTSRPPRYTRVSAATVCAMSTVRPTHVPRNPDL